MKPIGARYNGKKGWQIVHRCQTCGVIKLNRVAPDDMETLINKMKSKVWM